MVTDAVQLNWMQAYQIEPWRLNPRWRVTGKLLQSIVNVVSAERKIANRYFASFIFLQLPPLLTTINRLIYCNWKRVTCIFILAREQADESVSSSSFQGYSLYSIWLSSSKDNSLDHLHYMIFLGRCSWMFFFERGRLHSGQTIADQWKGGGQAGARSSQVQRGQTVSWVSCDSWLKKIALFLCPLPNLVHVRHSCVSCCYLLLPRVMHVKLKNWDENICWIDETEEKLLCNYNSHSLWAQFICSSEHPVAQLLLLLVPGTLLLLLLPLNFLLIWSSLLTSFCFNCSSQLRCAACHCPL